MNKSIFTTFLAKFSSAGLNFLIVILLSQFLGAEGRGQASLIITSVALVIIFCEFAGGSSLIYLIPRSKIAPLLVTAYTWSLGICIAAYFLLNVLFPASSLLLHIVVISFITSVTNANSKVFIAREKVELNNFIQTLQVAINFTLLLLFFWILKWSTIEFYIITLYVSCTIVLIVSFYLLLEYVKEESLKEVRFLFGKTLKYGTFTQTSNLSHFINLRISFYFIEAFWGQKVLGIYSNGASLAESIWLVAKSAALVLYSKITNTEDDNYSRTILLKVTKLTILISVILIFPLALLPGSFYGFLFGPDFEVLPSVILPLTPAILFVVISSMIISYFSGSGNYRICALATSLGAVVTLFAGAWLIPQYPFAGAGLTASLSSLVTASILLIAFFRKDPSSVKKLFPNGEDFSSMRNQLKKALGKLKK